MLKKVSICLLVFLLQISLFPLTVSAQNDEELGEEYYTKEYQQEIEKVNQETENYIKVKKRQKSYWAKKLAVPNVKQVTNYYCGAASAASIIKYKTGKSVSQHTLYNQYASQLGEEEGMYVWMVTATLNKYIPGNHYQHVGTWESSFSDSMVRSIDLDYPLVYHVKGAMLPKYLPKDKGHYIVGYGCKLGWQGSNSYNEVYFMDPFSGRGTFGKNTIDFNRLLNAIKAQAGYYIRGK